MKTNEIWQKATKLSEELFFLYLDTNKVENNKEIKILSEIVRSLSCTMDAIIENRTIKPEENEND